MSYLGKQSYLRKTGSLYCETINPRYSLPTFDFSPYRICVLHLPELILPQRMYLISKMNFGRAYYSKVPYMKDEKSNWAKRSWLAVWGNLTQIHSLESLSVVIHLGGLNIDWQWEENNTSRLAYNTFRG